MTRDTIRHAEDARRVAIEFCVDAGLLEHAERLRALPPITDAASADAVWRVLEDASRAMRGRPPPARDDGG